MTTQAEVQKLVAQIAAEKDPEKKKALVAEAQKLVANAKAAEQAEADALKAYQERAKTLPLYPEGLTVQFGTRTATITRAQKDRAGNWHYTIDLKAGEFLNLGDGVYEMSEDDMRSKVQEEVGRLEPWQAFAPGITLSRGRVSGLVEQVSKKAGQWTYRLRGWPREMPQIELQDLLMRS
jgi:hypothetical protein